MTCFSFLFRRRLDSSTNQPFEVEEEFGIHNVKLYTYKELRSATEDFSLANKIGEGGFGSVYKGQLKNGNLAAIKVLSAESRQGVKEFVTEIKVISEVEHENLVKLYGCCVEDNHRILVYNYLENNSLSQTLLGSGHSNIQFNWKTRSKICIGIARGLAFLHEEVKPYIVHRDIKASNILLDKDLTPKISDFGLAKLIPANMTHVSTRVAGTIGYLAPEYAIRGQLTRKADIYGFGVLLIEIVSGRCNTNTQLPVGEQYLLEQTWDLYERRALVGLVDISLNGDFDPEEACRFLKIGLLCTQDTPKLRPSMSSVVKMLTGQKVIDEKKITKPGLISDFMDLKVRSSEKTKSESKCTSSYNATFSSDNLDNSTLSSGTSTSATMTFNPPYDRSV
ncbi:putative serine/threonine-protein kinase [Herrania umbratica]|uniref:Serine/threonine-protein kinase n=1 Tax=Herrania umbratica TaxID=108875 RepID=A0A6J1ALU6_9ROSI|nr:putative serine/threonine-protein kinase [Herrania umbratica]XP_021287784.1 putative serine/threonine-protein kinase [Herrania umbratica]XP_021287785.1 putative serine/threonine-protein kinase [Herrania umbratica]XP_021287786.1 putative serine/threonine-protein kinase [Herrania umbratica]